MKKTIFTLIALFLVIYSNATIRRINNNPGVITVSGLVYSSISSAITDAVNGDTLYIEPSSTIYSLVNNTISKRLIWIGNGYDIGQNTSLINPLPQNTNLSQINSNPTFAAGSENSVMIGIQFNTNVNANTTGLQFFRCKFLADLAFNSSNILVDQCFFDGAASIYSGGNNNTVKNTIIGEFVATVSNVVFDHCYIQLLPNFSFVTNCTFTNSIINNITNGMPLTNTFTNCIKIGSGTTFPVPGINNNIEGVDMATLFVDADPMTPSTLKDSEFRLKAGSPAIGAGIGGVNIGPFGGATPYRLSGQAPVPIITNFHLSTTGSTASGLTGSITIQANN